MTKRKPKKALWVVIFDGEQAAFPTVDLPAVWGTRRAAQAAIRHYKGDDSRYRPVKYVRGDGK